MFLGLYKNCRVLVTGHTGFKGSWLCSWLLELGADVAGFSLPSPISTTSHFDVIKLKDRITHFTGDVRDQKALAKSVAEFKPDIIFHLAAQALVRESFIDPTTTIETNAIGTLNILEAARQSQEVKAVVLITSDKCYRNVEWSWGYRESDTLGGEDPYSASKACAENIAFAYIKSIFSLPGTPGVVTTRAGNVVGGGDWAKDRIVPDCVRAWSKGEVVNVRHPNATRPWQHVLDPLSGYLLVGARLMAEKSDIHGQAYNFGPADIISQTVADVINALGSKWPGADWLLDSKGLQEKPEATLLKLCCDKAHSDLAWYAVLSFKETMDMTVNWYHNYQDAQDEDIFNITRQQILTYQQKAEKLDLVWTKTS
jgi:CDP-glucose 4,6-dehydratase